MIHIKSGVKLAGLCPQIVLGIMVANEVYEQYDQALTITSGSDGEHSTTSLHYSGQAVDLRTRNIPTAAAVRTMADTIKTRLGEDFDVVVEQDHIHLEYQPRR